MIRDLDWFELHDEFMAAKPFNHVVIDDFFDKEYAYVLSKEFPKITDSESVHYANPLEHKTTMNHWDKFPICTYCAFNFLGGEEFVTGLHIMTEDHGLTMDFGLHGGGWHMHTRGGRNNIHLDYDIHPKLGQQRKINIIVYLSEDWNPEWGGALELWSANEKGMPHRLEKKVDNKFNRAILFDTTQKSWHGLPTPLTCPEGVVRKSLAAYYVHPVALGSRSETDGRRRALFVPAPEQEGDPKILKLIEDRADLHRSENVYRKDLE